MRYIYKIVKKTKPVKFTKNIFKKQITWKTPKKDRNIKTSWNIDNKDKKNK